MNLPASQPNNDILGVTVCGSCGGRLKLLAKFAHLVGKTSRCPKCHSNFVVALEERVAVAVVEKDDQSAAAPSASQEAQTETEAPPSRKRRTAGEIRQEYFDIVRNGFKSLHGRLGEIANAPASSEEEVRRWTIDVMRIALGYRDIEIDTEAKSLSDRIDIALKRDGKVFMIVECKNIRKNLSDAIAHQAARYALTVSTHWACVTNGKVWKLYRVTPVPGQEPTIIKVFEVALLDEDGISESDVEALYLLTSRAIFNGDTDKAYDIVACTEQQRLIRAILSDRGIDTIRKIVCNEYSELTGKYPTIDEDLMRQELRKLFSPYDL